MTVLNNLASAEHRPFQVHGGVRGGDELLCEIGLGGRRGWSENGRVNRNVTPRQRGQAEGGELRLDSHANVGRCVLGDHPEANAVLPRRRNSSVENVTDE